MKIEISGPACAFDSSGKQVVDQYELQRIGAINSSGEKCADYLGESLSSLGIEHGELCVQFDHASSMLRVITEYRVEKTLSGKQLLDLKNFTMAQWSDGIAENGLENQGQIKDYTISVYPIPYDKELVKVVQLRSDVTHIFWSFIKNIFALLQKIFGLDIEKIGRYGRTPLMTAILENNITLTLDLLAKGANVDHQDEDKCTCLQFAATSGSVQVVTALLKAGADVNQKGSDGTTAIMWAANRKHKGICEILIENGANLNIISENHDTVLSMASPEALDIVELLITNGANPLLPTKYGTTASACEFWQMDARRKSKRETDQEWANLSEAKAKLLLSYETKLK